MMVGLSTKVITTCLVSTTLFLSNAKSILAFQLASTSPFVVVAETTTTVPAELPTTQSPQPTIPFIPDAKEILSSEIYEQNLQFHQDAITKSETLFYGYNFTQQELENQPLLSWKKHSFPGSNCDKYKGSSDCYPPPPFGMEDLVRISEEPILTDQQCREIIQESESIGTYFGWLQSAARYGTPANRVGAIMPVEELSTSYTMINFEVLPKLFANICTTFDSLTSHQSTLRLGGARVVKYDASSGHVELGYHRDGLLLTCNIALSDDSDYTGGGTIIQALGDEVGPIRLKRGHAMVHPGDVLHCGSPITSGKRYVLVLFLLDTTIVPHDRYCAERGEREMSLARHLSSGDSEEKERHLSNAAKHFADAIACGARIDNGVNNDANNEENLAVEYQKLLRDAARHLGGKIKVTR